MSQIDHDAKLFAGANQLAAEWAQTFRRRTRGGEYTAAGRRVTTGVRQPNDAYTQFIKHAEKIEVSADRLDSFH